MLTLWPVKDTQFFAGSITNAYHIVEGKLVMIKMCFNNRKLIMMFFSVLW